MNYHLIQPQRGIEVQPVCLQQQLQRETPYDQNTMA